MRAVVGFRYSVAVVITVGVRGVALLDTKGFVGVPNVVCD